MNVLITGASGFVGSALCERLSNEVNTIVAPMRSPTSVLKFRNVNVVPITGLQYYIDWSKTLENIDVVIHLASRVHVMNDKSDNPLAEFRKINCDATIRLALQCVKNGVKRFIYLSSIKVNGEATFHEKTFSADDVPSPVDAYGISKYEAEKGLLNIAQETNMEVVIIRPPLVYGPHVKANFFRMMKWVYKGIPLPLGAINNRRSLLALDNLIDVIALCIKHPAAKNQIFLAADGDDLSTTELLKRVALAFNRHAFLIPVPGKLLGIGLRIIGGDALAQRLVGSLQVNTDKVQNLLDWRPPVSIDVAIDRTVKAFLLNEHRNLL